MQKELLRQFVFVLGREQRLAQKELEAVLARFDVCFSFYRISGNTAFANIENFSDDDAAKLIDALGGTIKIYRIVDSLQVNIPAQLSKLIYDEKKASLSKFNFGISNYNPNLRSQQINSFAIEAKKSLKGKLSLRYVESRDSFELSSILTLKNNLLGRGLEIAIFDDSIGVLVALNDPEEWNKRDYGKPASDKFSGMLPPKLARMMVNLALGEIKITKPESQMPNKNSNDQIPKSLEIRNLKLEIPQHEMLVVDPFCGSGSVLMEAMMLGCDVIGSDISEKAVADSKLNLEWLSKNYQIPDNKYRVFEEDATNEELVNKIHNSKFIIHNSSQQLVVVTEPYLGCPKKFKQTYASAEREYLKIKELYINFLSNIKQLTINDTPLTICLAFPLIETFENKKFSLYRHSVDEIRKLGYTQACEPFVYGRDYQVVKREIVLLRLKQE